MKTVAAAAMLLLGSAAALTPTDYEVTNLPGLKEKPGFKHYAGLLPIHDGHGTELFFWFVESARSPAEDPVVLWLNGGPGSSSVQFGFWTEHGPFRLVKDPTGPGGFRPTMYPDSWNKIANVLYVEAPSGVGYSSSTDPQKYVNITDDESSHDNFLFLQEFFKVFTQFKSNDFYVTAESYGGHYGPTLAEKLIDLPNDIPVKGLLIGNPGINSDWYYNVNEYAFVTYMWSHGLIPSGAYFKAVDACNWNQFFSNCEKDFTHPSAACLAATTAAVKFVPSPLDPYDVLAPTCHTKSADYLDGEEYVKKNSPELMRIKEKYNMNVTYNPCVRNWAPPYMNNKEVQAAIHVAGNVTREWPNTPPNWSYNQGTAGEKKDIALLFPKFFKERPNWKKAVVSGTADSAVPFLGTERWMNCLKRPLVSDFTKWELNEDVAGMVKTWDSNFQLITVKGCGHTIPSYCPQAGFAFFENWLTGKWD